jgi:hypothetical protein
MREVILEGIKTAPRSAKSPGKKFYMLTGPKFKMAASALKVLGALNALNDVLKSVTGYARRVVFDNVLPQWLKDVLAGDKKIGAFTVTTGDAKALIVPMKKYAQITEERADQLLTLREKMNVDIDIEEKHHYSFNQDIIDQVTEEKLPDLIEEISKALSTSKVLTAKLKKEIKSGKVPILEEKVEYQYTEDPLTNLEKYADGDVKKAMAIVETVKPVFAVRSFEMDDKEVQVEEALDIIKDNMDVIPDAEADEKKSKTKKKPRAS